MCKVNRIPYWDNVKAFLIILVVLGHTGTALGENWLSAIYAFHMPLFVLVSGYFSRKKRSLRESIGKLVCIFLIFDVAYLALDFILGEPMTVGNIITPGFSLWYILSLIFWRVLVFHIPESVHDKWHAVIGISVVASLLAGFIPVGAPLSFQRTFAFLPFFLSGYYLRRFNVLPQNMNRRNNVMLISLLLFAGLSALNFYKMPVFYANRPYIEPAEMALRLGQSSIAAVLCWTILRIIPGKEGAMTKIGESSLLIYLLHPPIVKLLKMSFMWGGGTAESVHCAAYCSHISRSDIPDKKH